MVKRSPVGAAANLVNGRSHSGREYQPPPKVSGMSLHSSWAKSDSTLTLLAGKIRCGVDH